MIQHLIGLSHWQIDLLVLYLFIQGAFFTVFPEEVVLPTLGILWGQGRVGFAEAFAVSVVGLLCGDFLLLLMGRYFGMRLLTKKPFSWVIDADTLNGALEKVKLYGHWLVFLVRFTPTVRAPMFFASGISRMSFFRFLRSDLAGLVIWVPALIVFGRRIGASGTLETAFHRIGFIMLLILATGLAVSIYRERQKRLRVRVQSE